MFVQVKKTKRIRPEKHERLVQIDSKNGLVTTKISDDFGKYTFCGARFDCW